MNKSNFNQNYMMNTVQKTATILRAFTKEEPKLTLTNLKAKTGIGISSLQRFLNTLVSEGFLIRDERTKQFQLGLSLFYLGKLVEQESSILTVAQPILKELNMELNESLSMSIIDANQRKCILNYESTSPLTARNNVGDTSPLYAGASAKALLAFFPEQDLEDYLNSVELNKITEDTITDRAVLKQCLQEIRQNYYAVTKNERVPGACSISAPILLNEQTKPLASISIIIPEIRFNNYKLEDLVAHLTMARREIERQLN